MRLGPLLLLVLVGGCLDAPQAVPDPTIRFDAIRFETEAGAFTAILFCDETPATCAFMRGLVERGYYDGRAFGRVIPGFVIQEVDRTGGTTDQTETVAPEFGTRVAFSAGAIGIARGSDPGSGGSEFFVMDHAASHLYGNYTAFAQVVEGLDVVHAIARAPAVRTGPASAVGAPEGSPVVFGIHDRVPVDPVVMTRVTPTTVDLPADVAAQYPLVTSESVRTDTLRATLEWPRDVAVGRESMLTWYVWPRDATPTGQVRDAEPFPLDDLVVQIDGAPVEEIRRDPTNGKLHFLWTPASVGSHDAILLGPDGPLAGATIVVR